MSAPDATSPAAVNPTLAKTIGIPVIGRDHLVLYGISIFTVVNLLVLYLLHFLDPSGSGLPEHALAVQSSVHSNEIIASSPGQSVGVMAGQSPIDLPTNMKSIDNKGYVHFFLGASDATVIHNEHEIKVNWNGGASAELNINGVEYKALQFHPHYPSEHTFNGKRYPFEVHIVHVATVGNATKLAVLGFLFDLDPQDKRNPFLDAAYKNIATLKVKGQNYTLPSLDASGLYASLKKSKIYRYPGSLTTPPYTEGVEWNVIQDIQYISRDQLKEYKDVMVHENSREVQPWGGRIPVLVNAAGH